MLVKNNECLGVIIFKDNKHSVIHSNATILATGGIGQIYKYTTNPLCATGDGLALAYRAKAKLRDMEFVQFHPTALAIDDPINHNRFLISEAVRGEGAKLCDKSGREYMQNYHELRELAPRDIVARANFIEMQKNNLSNVYLNAAVIGKEKLLKRFPTINKKCLEYGIDFTKDFIPVAPAAHYFMGGIETNLKGETSVKNLYAIGEVSSTGLHGANRLASNSLLECVVCAYECAKNIKINSFYHSEHQQKIAQIIQYERNFSVALPHQNDDINKLKQKLQETMWKNVGIFRSEETLKKALKDIENIEKEFGKNDFCSNIGEYELRNMLITSKLIILSALQRKESRGSHYRTDYQQTDKIGVHSYI